jgi:hypothetical protein
MKIREEVCQEMADQIVEIEKNYKSVVQHRIEINFQIFLLSI